jgi:AraC-like DNA-binding protein
VDGREYQVSAGDLLFVNLGSTHSFTCGKRFSYANLILKPEFINDGLRGTDNAFALLELEDYKDLDCLVDRNNLLVHLSAEESRQFEALIGLALSEQRAENPGKDLMLRSVFNALLTFTFRKMSLPMKKNDHIGEELLSYIRENCARRLSLNEIAADNHYSPAYFSRLFKNRTGQTFTDFVFSCRLDAAAKLLTTTDLSVGEICSEVGFSDRTKFFKLFYNRFGTSPLQYKKTKSNTF